MSRIQQTVVLDLQTSNILISVNYLPVSSVATKDFHFEENTERHSSTENTLYRRSIEMVNASSYSSSRIRCIQKAHSAFVPASEAKRKNTIDSRKIQAEKNKQRQYTGKAFLFRKKELHHKSLPLSNCLFWSVDHAFIPCCWPIGSLTDSSRAAACRVVALLLSSIPTSG